MHPMSVNKHINLKNDCKKLSFSAKVGKYKGLKYELKMKSRSVANEDSRADSAKDMKILEI